MAETAKATVKIDEKGLKDRLVKELQQAHDEGFDEGLIRGQRQILDWLQDAYINDIGRPDRGSPKAEAILEMANAAAKHFKLKLKVTD